MPQETDAYNQVQLLIVALIISILLAIGLPDSLHAEYGPRTDRATANRSSHPTSEAIRDSGRHDR